jgi:hypothetical protein
MCAVSLGYISYHYLPPGGSVALIYLLPILFSKKITKLIIAQKPLKVEKK